MEGVSRWSPQTYRPGSSRTGWPRGWPALACPPGERHDLGLMAFGIALNRTGRQIVYLGADTPVTIAEQIQWPR